MAIDMIERNELMATSRLGGMKRFLDDKYVNYTGGEDFYNLFGSRKRKKTRARMVIVEKYDSMRNLTDCGRIKNAIDLVNSDLESLVARSGNKPKVEIREQIDELQGYLGLFRGLYIKQGCAAKESEAASQKSQQETLGILTSLGESQVEKSKADISQSAGKGLLGGLFGGEKKEGIGLDAGEQAAAPSKNKKLLLYGGIGLGAIILVAVIVKLSRK